MSAVAETEELETTPEVEAITDDPKAEQAEEGDKQVKTLDEREREWLEDIKKKQHMCDVLKAKHETQDKLAKRCKKDWELAVDELQETIRAGVNPQLPLAFGDEQQPPAESDDSIEAHHARMMLTPIYEVIQASEKQRDKLDAAGVKTLGDFEQLRGGNNPDYPDGLRSLERVGQSTVDKWEAELEEFYTSNQYKPASEEPTEELGDPLDLDDEVDE